MKVGVLVVVAVMMSGSGCVMARMVAPPDVANGSDVLVVSERSQSSGWFVREHFKLGGYDIVDVDREAATRERTGIGPWTKEVAHAGASYALISQGRRLEGRCTADVRSHEFGGFRWGKSSLHCTCGTAEMVLSEHEQVLRVGGRVYGLSPVYELQGGASMPGGAGIRADGDGPLGAVEHLFPGQAWLRRDLDDATREQAACIFAGYILQRA